MEQSETCHEGFVIYKHEEMFAESLPLMKEIRRMGKLCDVTLKVEDQTFSAHRIVLASTIPYFYAMFTNDMAESREKEITMKEIDPYSLEALINFAYSGQVRIDNQNVQSLMVGASFLQLMNVRDACANFIISSVQPSNVLGIRRFADSLSCTILIESANKYIDKFFSKIWQSEEFLLLEVDELMEIIRRDDVYVESEETIFEAVIKWVKHDEKERAEFFPQVLALVRLPLLSPQYLADRVAREDLVRSSLQCRDLLDEAKDFHLMPERRDLLQKFRIRQRVFSIGEIFAVGGMTSHGEVISTVEIYNPMTKKWTIGEKMSMMRSRLGVAVLDGKLYAFAGFNGHERLSTVEVYDPKTEKWTKGKPLMTSRSAVGAAALDDSIYVCGGYDGITSLNTVECYCPKLDTVRTVAPMMKYRSAAGVAALNGYIYALGGHDGLSIYDSVERYDPVQDQWCKMSPMLNKRCRLGIATLDGRLYVCGGYDGNTFLRSVEVYYPLVDRWQLVAPMNHSRSRVALCANMGKLWAIGGYDGETNLSTVEVYDPEKDEWSLMPPMIAHSGGVGVGVINMQPKI